MSIKKALCRIGIMLSVTATVAIGQTTSQEGVKIGTLTWTKQNVNIETPNSWCYENDKSNCAKYGRLYTWEAAKKACMSMGGRWRLPTRGDWNNLVDYAGGEDVAGKKLKSKTGWKDNGNGTDEFGFSASPGGLHLYAIRGFSRVGNDGYWWSATEKRSGYAYYRYMHHDRYDVGEHSVSKSDGYSVRCVEDRSAERNP